MAEHDICPNCAKLNTFEEFCPEGIAAYPRGFLVYSVCTECGHRMFPEDVPKVQQEVP